LVLLPGLHHVNFRSDINENFVGLTNDGESNSTDDFISESNADWNSDQSVNKQWFNVMGYFNGNWSK